MCIPSPGEKVAEQSEVGSGMREITFDDVSAQTCSNVNISTGLFRIQNRTFLPEFHFSQAYRPASFSPGEAIAAPPLSRLNNNFSYKQLLYAAMAPSARISFRFATVAASKPSMAVKSWPHICALVITAWTRSSALSLRCSQ